MKPYKIRTVGGISEVGILKVREGGDLIRIAFVTFRNEDEIILFDAFDKPDLYEKAEKRRVDRMVEQFLDGVAGFLEDYLKNRRSVPLEGI